MGATPGPWATSKAKPRRVTANGKIICNGVLANGPGKANVKAEAEALANARLISAAPDLLQAALGCWALLESDPRYEGSECKEMARAAILKAEGDGEAGGVGA